MSRVYLVQVQGDDIASAMARLMDKLGLPSTCDRPIGIKVNMCDYRRRETGVTTDPLVLDPLLAQLRMRYPSHRIYLFEHDATGTLADNLFPWLGLDKVADKHGVEIVNLARERWVKVKLQGLHFSEIEVPSLLIESMIINHPKLKTHGRTKISCALKNIFACYRIKEKVHYHGFLDDAIVDINTVVKSAFTIVDGVLALEGNRGPTQGYPKKVGVLIGGNDVVAVDAFAARFMGFSPRTVKHILKSRRVGIGSMNYELESEIKSKEMNGCRFEFSTSKYYIMQLLRLVLK